MQKFAACEVLVSGVVAGCHVFDSNLSCSMMPGALSFNELLFGRCGPTYVTFDLLFADGIDLRPLPLRQRKARLLPRRVNAVQQQSAELLKEAKGAE
jgi:hypothetical protein